MNKLVWGVFAVGLLIVGSGIADHVFAADVTMARGTATPRPAPVYQVQAPAISPSTTIVPPGGVANKGDVVAVKGSPAHCYRFEGGKRVAETNCEK